ncbi:glycosyl hydrolase family 1 [Lysobacteraceae bacterium NML120232]|nr:glycosyl hydrolase family 1 [Xanthomonadaceae bacterium NML08-0793]PJK09720.1 glycosyl hydrolase family 1 [Xanthomonadaceae bacterium NML120232]
MPASSRSRLYRLARQLYWQLPLSRDAKDRMVVLAYRHLGRWLAGMPHYESWLRGQQPQPMLPQVRGPVAPQDFDAVIAQLAFAACSAPEISIVIPAYGDLPHVLACLQSIAANPPSRSYEVIVAEDASGQVEMARLADIPGLRYLPFAENLGFLRASNRAVANARGHWLVLLNSDVEVGEGAFDALWHTFQLHPNCGLVGAKLYYPDGRLQEAGGILWRDGTAWNWGRFDDGSHSRYNFVRDVDYVSAAAVMMPLALFRTLGGFDAHFAPAYCEDSDLAMRVRAAGKRVLYQPAAHIIHHEGISHGRDTGSGIKAMQLHNQAKLRQRWAKVLNAGHFPNGEQPLQACERDDRPLLLLVDSALPEPERDAGSRTLLAFIEALQALGWRIKYWPQNLAGNPEQAAFLQQRGIEVIYGECYRGRFDAWLRDYAQVLKAVLLSRPLVADSAIGSIRRHAPNARIVYYGHDLHYRRLAEQAQVSGDKTILQEGRAMQRLEQRIWRDVDAVLYPSAQEAELVRSQTRTPVSAIPAYRFYVSTRTPPSPAGRSGLLFVAGFAHAPNIDAALWYVDTVLPLVHAQWPDVQLILAGSNPDARVRALASDQVCVTGQVSEAQLQALYAKARVVVVPLRFGAGVKHKVVEAMHLGVPVVTTDVGAQGLEDTGEALSIATAPAAMAARTGQLLHDDAAWLEQVRAGQAWVDAHYSKTRIQAVLAAALSGDARFGQPAAV